MQVEKFFDRQEYLEILQKRVLGLKEGYRQNLAIIGDELVGKTALIFKFLNKFWDNRIIVVYLEVRPDSLSAFAKKFIGILLYNFLINNNAPLKEDLNYLIERSRAFVPKTVEKIKNILLALEKRKKQNILQDLFSLCDTIHRETSKSCVVILDEFHNLEKLGTRDPYKEWSKLILLQKNTLYIIISSMKFKTRVILSKNLSLLFGNFQLLSLEPFDIKTTETYLDYKLQGLDFSPGLRNFLVHFTGGYPFYLEIITDALLKSKEASLVDILVDLFFESSGILHQRFSTYLKRFQDDPHGQDYLAILYLIAGGHNRIKDIAHRLTKQKSELISRISHLLEIDVLTRSGDFFSINDRVFGFWLKFVYREKVCALTFDAQNKRELLLKQIEVMIENFIQDAQKPFKERVTELMQLFQDDTIQIERKRLRLSHFREIKALEFNSRNIREGLIGRSNDSLWIVALKPDTLTEDDIVDFVKECKKYHHKLQRKIIITLREVDQNAHLRAMEEKVFTWDLNKLNQIFDLFCQSRVIV
jgi:hypothetical protein